MSESLRVLAERRGFHIGSCASAQILQWDRQYAQTLGEEFNVITPENEMKFGVVSPERGRYDFSAADAIVEFAEAKRIGVRGHVLVWHAQLPHWLVAGSLTRSALVRIMTDHITVLVGRYAGRITGWDVVNEAIGPDGKFRDSVWYQGIGPEYVEIAFRAARAADPSARLFYNDSGIESTDQHLDAVHELLRELKRRAVPVDGVGLETHLDMDEPNGVEKLAWAMNRLGALGLEMAVTELDVRMTAHGHPTAEQLATQAHLYRLVLRACLGSSNCDTCVLWGLTDRHSWVPHFFPGKNAALIFDENYRKKAAYQALAEELASSRG